MFNLIPQNVQSTEQKCSICIKDRKYPSKRKSIRKTILSICRCTRLILSLHHELPGSVWNPRRVSLFMAGVPCQHLPVACLYCDACRLSGGVLSGRTVCRFWNQRVLPAGFGVWLDTLEQRKEKEEHTAG